MTQIIMLACEPETPGSIQVLSGDMSLAQAEAMCQAAARHFREQAIEAEIQRRLAARKETVEDSEDD